MAKVKEITVEIGIKPSQNYNSWHMDLSATFELTDEESDRWEEVYVEKLGELKKQLQQEHSKWYADGLW